VVTSTTNTEVFEKLFIEALRMSLETIQSDFELLDDWEDRYRYIIDLGRDLPALSAEEKTEDSKVQGCVSQVWLVTSYENAPDPIVHFRGESDAHIVRGLVALVLAIYTDKHASEILKIDALAVLKSLGLDQHLSPQRSNGLKAMIDRIRREATRAVS
jgi:cysteine desulfuration protein SufE